LVSDTQHTACKAAVSGPVSIWFTFFYFSAVKKKEGKGTYIYATYGKNGKKRKKKIRKNKNGCSLMTFISYKGYFVLCSPGHTVPS